MAGRESPDGRYFYYAKPESDGLWRMALSGGGREEQVVPTMGREMRGNWNFAPAGIFYLSLDARGNLGELKLFDFASAKTSLVYTTAHLPLSWDRGLSVSADGSSAFFAEADRVCSDTTLVENFR